MSDTNALVEACARAAHGALSRANITAYLDMPEDTAEIVARAVIPVVLDAAAEVAREVTEQWDTPDHAIPAGVLAADAILELKPEA